MPLHPLEHRSWIFDLDGTLTVPIHDFERIRRELGLPAGVPILEALAELPPAQSEPLHRRLEEIEAELAALSTPQEGARALLEQLAARGARCGILTRNTRANAMVTLEACGLREFFAAEDVLGRREAPAKPDPEGVRTLLARWEVAPSEALFAGDFLFDLQAGRAAGVTTLYIDGEGLFPHAAWADRRIRRWTELLVTERLP